MPESEYPFEGLAGVGLAFKLAHGLIGDVEVSPFLQSQLDLVALGTVVDIATLTGENRVLTKLGLAELNKRERPGIRALCDVANYSPDKPIVGHTLSYVLGPRLNAAGRMDAAEKVVRLLTVDSYEEALPIAEELDTHNRERRDAENRIRKQAIAKIKKDVDLDKVKGLVIAHKGWHQGVIGIVASRILEQYYRPVFLLAIDGEEAHGSGRGIDGINLADSLNACTDLLIKHGGHKAAAGLTIKTENIPKFERRFNRYVCEHLSDEDFIQQLSIEFEIQMSYLSLEVIQKLHLLEPW
jgi:single-stranded-DNA-specific exonuclease